jgi:uncharacterized protein YbbK (DUF523 family)
VNVNGAVSNGVPFTVRSGRIFFVSTGGNDGNNGSYRYPWATLTKARSAAVAGDIVYVMNGVQQTGADLSSASLALVSGCLAGQKCRYDGGHWSVDALRAAAEAGEMVPVCPERLGGLPAPRGAAEIVRGTAEDVLDGKARVMDCYGQDVTGPFVTGAQEVLALAMALRVDRAILKEHSPSCGSSSGYDGTFTRAKVAGEGVCAALLRRNGIKVEGAG